jgi:hypothetical protein
MGCKKRQIRVKHFSFSPPLKCKKRKRKERGKKEKPKKEEKEEHAVEK